MSGENKYDCPFVSIHYIICECGETFPSENALRSHLEKEHPTKRERKEYKCGVCGSTFVTEDECITHYEDSHITEQDIKSEEIVDEDTKPNMTNHEAEITEEAEYMYHVEMANGEEVIQNEQMSVEEVVNGEEVIHGEVIDGVQLLAEGEEIAVSEGQVLHIPEDYGQVIQQPDGRLVLLVNNKSNNKATIISTAPTITKDKPKKTNPGCNIRSLTFNHRPETLLHIQESARTASARKSQYTNLTTPILLNGQVTNITLPIAKDQVSKLTKPIVVKRSHLFKPPVHNLVNSAVNVITEPIEEEPTNNIKGGPNVRNQRQQRKVLPKNRVCEVCGSKYTSNAALRYHQRVHTGEKPFECHLCPKKFTMPLFLQVHIRTHTGERPYQCQECPKAFSNRAALLRHERVHSGVRPYPCPMCGKTFTQSNSMKLHVTTVHLRLPTPYKSRNRKMKAQENALRRGLARAHKTAPAHAHSPAHAHPSHDDNSNDVVVKHEPEPVEEEEEEEEEMEEEIMEEERMEENEVKHEEEESEQVYEMIESEEINEEEDDQCYTIVYE